MHKLTALIEAFILASETPVKPQELSLYLEKLANNSDFSEEFGREFPYEKIVELIENLREKYQANTDTGITLRKVAGGYIFATKKEYGRWIARLFSLKNARRLSRPLMETLSIIAYKQPVTKVEIEEIRGVDSAYSVHKLLESELIRVAGRSDAPGRPLLYKTTDKFLQLIGLNSLDELPKPKEMIN